MSDPTALPDKTKSGTPAQKDEAGSAKRWLKLISDSKKREEKWRKKANDLQDIYQAETLRENAYNIVYSNTETMRPAVLGSIPRPRVRKRWENQDITAKLAAEASERLLTFLADPGSAASSPFGFVLKEAVRGGLVVGRANSIFQYEPQFGTAPYGLGDPETAADNTASGSGNDENNVPELIPTNAAVTELPAAGEDQQEEEVLVQENICGYPLQFQKVYYGYCESWSDLPWIAVEYDMTKEDLVKNFGQEKANATKVDSPTVGTDRPKKDQDAQRGMPDTALVYAIWYKQERQVIYVSDGYEDGILNTVDDPLELSGFFPIPEQLCFFTKAGSLEPVPLYAFYEAQAKELNKISIRINKIISVIKARGIYDATLTAIEQLKDKDDGELVAAKNVAALGATGSTLEKAIWMWPLEAYVNTLQQLYLQRSQVKQVIYEITGLSDILRGASVASETATAQTIKNQWGSLRLRDSQNAVGIYARNCFRIMLEIAVNRFGVETWQRMTQLGVPTDAEQMAAQQQLAALQQQAQQQAALAQMQQAMSPGQPGTPPQGLQGMPTPEQPSSQQPSSAPTAMPNQAQSQGTPAPSAPPTPPPPQQNPPTGPSTGGATTGPSDQMVQLQQTASSPTWEMILQELKQNVKDGYLIDIETNSTLDQDATEDKADVASLVTAMSQLFQSLGPAVESGAIPVAAVKAILLAILQRYRFGDEIEDIIRGIPDMPAPPGGQGKQNPAAAAAMQKAQAEVQAITMKAQAQQESDQMDMDFKKQELAFKQQELQMKADLAQREQAMKMQAIEWKAELAMTKHQRDLMIAQMPPATTPGASAQANPTQVPAQQAGPALGGM